jgi:hypothetical protein
VEDPPAVVVAAVAAVAGKTGRALPRFLMSQQRAIFKEPLKERRVFRISWK